MPSREPIQRGRQQQEREETAVNALPRSKTELNSRRLRIRRWRGNPDDEPLALRATCSTGVATRGCGLIVSIALTARDRGGPTSRPSPPARPGLRGGNRQPLAAFGAATLQDVTAIFRGHAHQEAMSAPAAAAIRLKRAFTLHNARNPCELRNGGENVNSSEPCGPSVKQAAPGVRRLAILPGLC